MNAVAVYVGKTVVFWNGIVIALAIFAGFFLAYAIYTSHSGRGVAMWAMLPLAIVFSVLFCRILHYFCFPTQYSGFLKAVTSFSTGSYCLPGAVFGIWLAAFISAKIGFADSAADILDAAAPGALLTFAFVRLSALFNASVRGKEVIKNAALQRLPIASAMTDAAGNVTYRFATFFVSFILLAIASFALVGFYFRRHNSPMKRPCGRDGHVARIGLLLWACAEIICDSTRFDAPHLKFSSGNAVGRLLTKAAGFVGTNMVIAAVAVICIFVYYWRAYSRSADRKGALAVIAWVIFAVCLAAVGVSEYFYQRCAFLWLYGTMAFGLAGWITITLVLYHSCRGRETVWREETVEAEETEDDEEDEE